MGRVAGGRVFPVKSASGLESKIRLMLQNPRKILAPHIKPGSNVLDVGCGPGVFSIELAKLVGQSGHVVAADLQTGMLQIVEKKVRGTALENVIETFKCESERIGLDRKVDFILVFYMLHEVPNQTSFLEEARELLNDDGRIFIVEPRMHVSGNDFKKILESMAGLGFEVLERPKIFFSRSLLAKKSLKPGNISPDYQP